MSSPSASDEELNKILIAMTGPMVRVKRPLGQAVPAKASVVKATVRAPVVSKAPPVAAMAPVVAKTPVVVKAPVVARMVASMAPLVEKRVVVPKAPVVAAAKAPAVWKEQKKRRVDTLTEDQEDALIAALMAEGYSSEEVPQKRVASPPSEPSPPPPNRRQFKRQGMSIPGEKYYDAAMERLFKEDPKVARIVDEEEESSGFEEPEVPGDEFNRGSPFTNAKALRMTQVDTENRVARRTDRVRLRLEIEEEEERIEAAKKKRLAVTAAKLIRDQEEAVLNRREVKKMPPTAPTGPTKETKKPAAKKPKKAASGNYDLDRLVSREVERVTKVVKSGQLGAAKGKMTAGNTRGGAAPIVRRQQPVAIARVPGAVQPGAVLPPPAAVTAPIVPLPQVVVKLAPAKAPVKRPVALAAAPSVTARPKWVFRFNMLEDAILAAEPIADSENAKQQMQQLNAMIGDAQYEAHDSVNALSYLGWLKRLLAVHLRLLALQLRTTKDPSGLPSNCEAALFFAREFDQFFDALWSVFQEQQKLSKSFEQWPLISYADPRVILTRYLSRIFGLSCPERHNRQERPNIISGAWNYMRSITDFYCDTRDAVEIYQTLLDTTTSFQDINNSLPIQSNQVYAEVLGNAEEQLEKLNQSDDSGEELNYSDVEVEEYVPKPYKPMDPGAPIPF